MDLNIEVNLSNIKRKSKLSFKNLVKMSAHEYEFTQLLKSKQKHSKLENLWYSKLEMQKYLELNNMNNNEAQVMFKYRTRMAKYGENFRGNKSSVMCPLCHTHLDDQKIAFENCQVLKENIRISENYNLIFNTSVPSEVVKIIMKIEQLREQYLSLNEANSTRQPYSWMGASDNSII